MSLTLGLREVLKLLAACVVLLGLAACKTPENGAHQRAMKAANARWLSARSTILLQSAQRQFDTGDLTQSERTLSEALSMDPGNAELHTLAGRIALERGQLERAYQRFELAIETDDKFPAAHYYQGIVLQRWQRLEKAMEQYERAFELEADNVGYLLSIAEMHVAMDDLDAATALLESKAVYFDQNAGIRSALGRIYAMRGQHDKAALYFEQAMLLQPDSLSLLEELSMAQLAAGQFRKATANFEHLCAEPTLRDRADLKRALASCYFKSGRVEDARQIYIRLTRQDPTDAEAWVRLGELAWSQDDLAGSLLAANRVIAVAPNRHEGYLLAGMVWQKRGRVDEALRLFDSAANAAPDDSLPLILRGIALEQAGRQREAGQAYAQALQRQPDDARARKLLANVSEKL